MIIVGPALVWLGGGYLSLRYGLTVGTIVAFVALLGRLYTPASTLAGIQVQIVSALAVFERIFEYLDMPPEPSGTLVRARIDGAIDFEDVHFSYTPERPALRGVDLHIEPGQVAAFVGRSGAGKTTITQLVPRFYDPQEGRILVDGTDVREFDIDSLRSHIGIVTQETYLFHDTIGANLRYGRIDATQAELETAAAAANMAEFIASLPEGYDTVVGERGHKLSGGERQRLAIARVLLKDPRILILDEATSALDSENEAQIQAAFEKAMQGRTSLVIAHRPVDDLVGRRHLRRRPRAYRRARNAPGTSRTWRNVCSSVSHAVREARPLDADADTSHRGRRRPTIQPAQVLSTPQSLLRVDGLTKRFERHVVLDGLGFTLGRGEVLGLARAERRRQDDHLPLPLRLAAARRRGRFGTKARRSAATAGARFR